MYIIGLAGKSGSGKDYIAKMMYDLWGYYPLPLALGVKMDAVSKYGISYEDAFINKPPHVRNLLQKIGTDSGRQVYGEDMWINVTVALAQWISSHWGIDKFVLPDVRFKNEMNYLQNNGYFVIGIIADATLKAKYGLRGEAATHPSEVDLDDVPVAKFDGLIINSYNNDESLHNQLERVLTSFDWDRSIFNEQSND